MIENRKKRTRDKNKKNDDENPKGKNNDDAPQKAKFKILMWNCNSIKGKIEFFKMLLHKEKPDIVCLTETKCATAEAFHFLNINGYQATVYNRNNFGGGAALLIADKFFTEAICINQRFVDNDVEFVGTRISLGNKDFNFFAYYNPPWRKPDRRLLKYIDENFDNYLVLGDFNCKLRPWDTDVNPNGTELASILSSTRGQILNEINMPTFFRTVNNVTSTSTLDLAVGSGEFINAYKYSRPLHKSHVDVFQRSYYHIPMILGFELEKETRRRKPHNKALMYFRANWEKFQSKIESKIHEINESSKETIYKDIAATIFNAAKEAIPSSAALNNRLTNYPDYIVKLNSLKNYWHRQFNKYKTEESKNNLEICRTDLIEEVEKHRRLQWQAFLDALGPSPLSSTPFWRKINGMRGKKAQSGIGTIVVDGVKLTSDKDKAEAFAKRLESIFTDDNHSHYDNAHKIDIENFFNENMMETMFTDKSVPLISSRELENCIKNANSKTSSDVDGISNRMLKHLPESMKAKLLLLFNKCLTEMKVPAEWKQAIVQMITKKSDDPTNIKNFRPISITLCIARLFERILLGRLQKHLKRNKVIIDNQSGFRRARQTKDNLIALVQKSLEATSNGGKVVTVFFDIASAFDKVWHKGLIYKLAQINTPYYLIKIIEDFLDGRTFKVKIDEYTTESFEIKVGVPQGAVLSPTLFSIYINDVCTKNEKNKSYTMLFADDIVYFEIYESWSVALENEMNSYLSRLETWMNKWRLALAPHKCQYTIFTKNRRINTEKKFKLILYGIEIAFEKNPVFLGITFDPYLSFANHIDKTIEKAQSRINILKIVSHYSTWRLDHKTQVNIYISLVRSLFEYMDFIYGILGQNAKDRLNAVQNNALRIIFKKKREECSVADLHVMANIPRLCERLTALSERYFDKNFALANPILERLVEECIEFHNEILIEDACANEFFDLNMIRAENKEIRRNVVEKNTTILSRSSTLKDILWPITTDYDVS